MLEVVDQRVLEGRIEQRRHVAAPHDGREEEPGHERMGDHLDDPRAEHGEDPAVANFGRCHAQQEGDRGGQHEAGAGPEDDERVLDHVDGEELGVVALDPGEQGDGEAGQADEPEDGPVARAPGCRGWARVDPPDGPQVGGGGERASGSTTWGWSDQPERNAAEVGRRRHLAAVGQGRRDRARQQRRDREGRERRAEALARRPFGVGATSEAAER